MMTGIKLYVGSILLNIWAVISRTDVTFVLSTISTVLVIAYYIIKLRQEIKKK